MAEKSVDTPLAEITLRKYERPKEKPEGKKERRELVRKICLSMGLLQPGDSRDVVVDILQVILEAEGPLTSKEVEQLVIEKRKDEGLKILGVAPSNIRRQLLRLRDTFLVEKIKNKYRIHEKANFEFIFQEKIEDYYLKSIIKRVKEYMKKADETFLKD